MVVAAAAATAATAAAEGAEAAAAEAAGEAAAADEEFTLRLLAIRQYIEVKRQPGVALGRG